MPQIKEGYGNQIRGTVKGNLSQFAQNETTIGRTPITKMMIDTRDSEPVSQKPYPIVMKHYKWVKDKINKLLTAKVT